ncbi:radical SAM protein [Candidatus Bathyarchaeota archaeon]|nr:radical SAM protein [Candidatus Bathyarchaeota archaeon]
MPGREIRLYYPMPRFPSVSVTGGHCDLMCSHCRAHYLGHMPDVSSPDRLRRFCVDHEATGGVGLLVSGGSTREGRVPLKRFLSTLRWVKENTGLIVNLHTGMLDAAEAEEVASTGVDIVSVDMVGSDETLRKVYGLRASVDEYGETLTTLREAGAPSIAPHICVGLHYGELRGERRALQQALAIEPEVVVFLGLIPTKETPMEDVSPPPVDAIVGLMRESKRLSPGTEVSLGCMRSRGYKTELEWGAIEAGADRVALASRSTEARAVEAGYEVVRLNGCCATPRSLEEKMV